MTKTFIASCRSSGKLRLAHAIAGWMIIEAIAGSFPKD